MAPAAYSEPTVLLLLNHIGANSVMKLEVRNMLSLQHSNIGRWPAGPAGMREGRAGSKQGQQEGRAEQAGSKHPPTSCMLTAGTPPTPPPLTLHANSRHPPHTTPTHLACPQGQHHTPRTVAPGSGWAARAAPTDSVGGGRERQNMVVTAVARENMFW